jgi:23S rRNA pseudouridine1911/1915/1917 synthase
MTEENSEIIFCDNHLLIAEKPAGIATQPDFIERLRVFLKKRFNKPGKVFLEPIHRLDKPVSGIVICARTSKALSRLQEQMRQQEIKKQYCALVTGALPCKEGTLVHFLKHLSHRAAIAKPHEDGSKKAELFYQVLREEEGCSLLRIHLQTGRYHQIRAQLSAVGSPILGDSRYGSVLASKNGCIALHHEQIEFIHPVSREPCLFLSKKNAAMKPNMAIAAAKKLIWANAFVKED